MRLVCLLFYCPLSVFASQWSIQIENDVTFYQDSNYTNGLALSWQSDYYSNIVKSEQLSALTAWQSHLMFKQSPASNNYGFKLSQRMWTPNEITIEVAQPFDRPYAGLLELEHHTASYSDDFAQKNWLTLGVIGPAAGAEKVQSIFHSINDASSPNGWPYQVENQATIGFAYEVEQLIYRKQGTSPYAYEFSGYGYGSLSNFRSEVNGGLQFRWGTDLANSFGRSSSHYGQVGNITNLSKTYNITFFTRAQLGYRFNDLSLSGNLPYQSQVEIQRPQARVDAGISLAFSNFAILWSVKTYTRDYQSDSEYWHGYGSLSVNWSFE